jgi:hypothetical protein
LFKEKFAKNRTETAELGESQLQWPTNKNPVLKLAGSFLTDQTLPAEAQEGWLCVKVAAS